MKEFKFTGTMRPDRILPDTNYSKEYHDLRRSMVAKTGCSYPGVEVTVRFIDKRQDWIDRWYAEARDAEAHGEIFIKHCKDVTIVAAWCLEEASEIVCAAPRHGDKYDPHTGIAVAYVKFRGYPVPDFI